MLKKLALALAFAGFVTYSYAQGSVDFSTSTLGTTARVYLPGAIRDGSTNGTAGGTNFFAQLFTTDGTGQAEGSLVAVGNPVILRSGVGAGYVQTTGTYPAGTPLAGEPVNAVVQVTTVVNGPVTLQMRVWSAAAGNDYQTAVTGAGFYWGASNLLDLNVTGGGAITPPQLTGLQGFNLTLNPIPEPSTIGLGILGAGSFLFLRRKKYEVSFVLMKPL